ncbi:MAG: aldo/keto reductase [Spirochaetaceae bacterium]|jgi:predicted aldo/keto reductase-like oxidoreductase|nr:aldo/keto reductase [Spirochaetaceae bacterium]
MDYLGKEIPKLGFGAMRLPRKEGAIDIAETSEMVDRFLAAGFQYVDTAFGYEDSEEALGKALVARHPRESYFLATKLPAFAASSEDAAKAMLTTSLKRTGAGYFDFYLLHNIGASRTAKYDEYHIWDYVLEQKAKGLIKHVGFSFHDSADVLDKYLSAHPEAEFVQLQINWADWDNSSVQSAKCYEVARKYGKPVVIMEPVKGGMLATPPESVAKLFKAANPDASIPSWGIRFAASLEGVITVLSGMSNIAQMDDNIKTMKAFQPLTKDDYSLLEKARKELEVIPQIPCTGCQYCTKGCPQHVAIPDIFAAVNNYRLYMHGNKEQAKANYGWIKNGLKGPASNCIQCGACEAVCPQKIQIVKELEDAVEIFEK